MGGNGDFQSTLQEMFKNILQSTLKLLKKNNWKSKYLQYFNRIQIMISEEILNQILSDILELAMGSNKLGQIEDMLWEKYNKNIKEKEDLEDFLSILVESGYLLINKDENYYVPSLFALQAFVEDLSKNLNQTKTLFSEFINHPLIIEMLQYSGQMLGWSLELILKYALLKVVPKEITENHSFPRDFGTTINLEIPHFQSPTQSDIIRGDLNASSIQDMVENTYYLFPTGKGFDGLFRDGDNLLVVQIKAVKNLSTVMSDFTKFKKNIRALQTNLGQKHTIIPWFLSFHGGDFSKSISDYKGLITSEKDDWEKLLGKRLVERHRLFEN